MRLVVRLGAYHTLPNGLLLDGISLTGAQDTVQMKQPRTGAERLDLDR